MKPPFVEKGTAPRPTWSGAEKKSAELQNQVARDMASLASLEQTADALRARIQKLDNYLKEHCADTIIWDYGYLGPSHGEDFACAWIEHWQVMGALEISLTGRERAAGEVFLLSASNLAQSELSFEIPAGTVIEPSDSKYQRMVIGETISVSIPPKGTAQIHIHGYCLDHGKLPPPPVASRFSPRWLEKFDSQKSSLSWSITVDQSSYRTVAQIVKTGNRLALEKKYNSTIQEPEKYKEGVIERALWLHVDKLGKKELSDDIERQLEKLPQEKRPSLEEKNRVVDSIWDDVNLTLKEAELPE